MRTAHGIYRQLQAYLDFEAKSGNGKSGIDEHFKSGVELGTGLSSLMLSLMPGKALRVGYTRSRSCWDILLMGSSAGGRALRLRRRSRRGARHIDGSWRLVDRRIGDTSWERARRRRSSSARVRHGAVDVPPGHPHPHVSRSGMRPSNMALTRMDRPIGGVNVPLAKNILKWNLERYPNGECGCCSRQSHLADPSYAGIFFMYFKSRLHTTQSQPEMANDTLQEALDLKLEYLQVSENVTSTHMSGVLIGRFGDKLQHMCLVRDKTRRWHGMDLTALLPIRSGTWESTT